MRILDIDLDFFLDDVAHWRSDAGTRLNSEDYKVWDKEKVIEFLEKKCGLNKNNKIQGRILEHHDEALYFWKYLIDEKILTVPFEVTHIDAHADLGMGDSSFSYIFKELLSIPVGNRINEKSEFLSCGNYLSYCIAYRWIKKLTYVTHPEGGRDIPYYHYKNFDYKSGKIQLKHYSIDIDFSKGPNLRKVDYLSVEPEVEFKKIKAENFIEYGEFDYIVISISPGFTPVESDDLISVIKDYIIEI